MKVLDVADLGLQPYGPVWDLQKAIHQERVQGKRNDTLLLVEHHPVYTIGKNGKREHITASSTYLKKENIEVYHVDRGGDVTYHGPGQLVGYPIFHLPSHRLGVVDFVRGLEEVFLELLKAYGISAQRVSGYTGVWVGEEKIVAIGIRVVRWTTMHGFSFNIKPNLSHFLGIIPCGITSKGVTSLERLMQEVPPLSEIKEKVVDYFCKIFDFDQRNIIGGEIWNSLSALAQKNS